MANIRVYMADWHINSGIMGFMRILDFSEIPYVKEANYVEFDSSILKDFPTYYFNYFLDRYSKKNSIERNLNYQLGSYNKEYISLKDYIKNVKSIISVEATKLSDKGTGFDNDAYLELKGILDSIPSAKDCDIETVKESIDKCMAILGSDRINERLTLNVVRSVFSKSYFGQVSYLQKNGNKLTAKECGDILYADFLVQIDKYYGLLSVVESGNVLNILNYANENIDDLSIKGKYSDKRVKPLLDILKKVVKILSPKKPLSDDELLKGVNDYLSDLRKCDVCGDFGGLLSDMTEGIFAPILLSSANSYNFYWNLNIDTKLCDICRLMYLCSEAGTVKEGDKYTFVNMTTGINDLYNTNTVLSNKVNRDSGFEELVSYLVDVDEQKSKWKLNNIQVVEYFSDMESKKSRVEYYNIPPYIVNFLVSKDVEVLKGIKDYKLKKRVLKSLTSNRDIKEIILSVLFDVTKGVKVNTNDISKIVALRYIVEKYKKAEVLSMNTNVLKMVMMRGKDIRVAYKYSGTDSRLNTLIYKLLNTVKVGNKSAFTDIVLRIFNNCKMNVPNVFVEVLSTDDSDFENIAYAFIAGLSSDKYDNNDKDGAK